MMNGRGKSDSAIVAERPTNKAGRPAEGPEERRAETEENAGQQSTRRAQNRESVSQALDRIRQAARQRKKEKFTALLHHMSPEHLEAAFFELKENAAPGVDGLTWRAYEEGLDAKILDLHSRLHKGAYRALPSRRIYIPNVWSDRALQENFHRVGGCAVLHQCIRPLIGASCAPGHHGYQRACDLITGKASRGHLGHQCSHAPGRPILHLVSNPLADLGR